jgi:uncharacterized integral membrane protein
VTLSQRVDFFERRHFRLSLAVLFLLALVAGCLLQMSGTGNGAAVVYQTF